MLSKTYRLRKRGSFTYVRVHGTRYSEPCISLTFIKGNCKRVGIVVSNKIGKAVRRNLVKRRLRGAVAELLPGIPGGQYIIAARMGIEKLEYAGIKASLIRLFGNIKG